MRIYSAFIICANFCPLSPFLPLTSENYNISIANANNHQLIKLHIFKFLLFVKAARPQHDEIEMLQLPATVYIYEYYRFA